MQEDLRREGVRDKSKRRAAGATRLTSPQESANSGLKKAMAMKPKRKLRLLRVRAITAPRPTIRLVIH
jgi:hypothetical protein